MITIKAHTTIEQSRKLIEILSLESADMHYNNASIKGINYVDEYRAELMDYNTAQKVLSKYLVNPMFGIIPCWSLSALFGVLPTIDDEFEPQLHRSLDKYFCTYEGEEDSSGLWRVADNPIDACYEMIIKLHELRML